MVKWLKKPFIILGISVGVGVITFAVHVIRKRNKEEILAVPKTCKRINRTLKVPKGFVGHILGRGGATIKSIREKTKARISFDDQGSDYTIVTIVGMPDEVDAAADEINKIVSGRHATVTRELDISEGIAASIWKNVYCIREICSMSRAKIVFEFLPPATSGEGDHPPVRVVIKGRREEVEAASSLVDELVARAQAGPPDRSVHVAGRALPDNLPLNPNNMRSRALPGERLVASGGDGFLEVYVSAVDSPGRFWAQVAGSKSVQLDRLATQMTDFYADERNRDRLRLSSVRPGDIVAAFYRGDDSWYRAQVIRVDEGEVSVFYLDFGDCALLEPRSVCVLKPDFLSIPFQAVECCLAGVGPPSEGWPEDATDAFERLVHLGQWRVMMARPLGERPRQQNGDIPLGSCVQLLQLMDTSTEVDLDVAERLVAMGLAKRHD